MKRVLENNRNPKQYNQGAVLVELAIVLPLLTLLLVVIIDLGLVLWEHQVVQNAAREGARFSALQANWVNPVNPLATEAVIKQRVIDYLQGEGITVNAGDITVDQTYPITIGALTPFGSEVTVTYNRSLLIPAGALLPTSQLALTGRSVFRNLY